MSKSDSADDTSMPSRRHLFALAGATLAKPSLSAPAKAYAAHLPPPAQLDPFPKAMQGEDQTIAIAQSAAEAFVEHLSAIDAFKRPEKAMIRWRRRIMRSKQQVPRSSSGDVVSRRERKLWYRREQAAMQRLGYLEAQKALDQAADKHFDALSRLQASRPTTLAGLVTKARICRENPDDHELAQSLTRDIGLLAGDIDPD
jgi:hypothetical protein